MNGANHVHTADNAVPPITGNLADTLDDLTGIHPGIDLIRDGIRLIALDRHTPDTTQTLIAALAGGADGTNCLNLIGQLIDRLADPDTNPALRTLPFDQQKTCRMHGETTAYVLSLTHIADFASNTAAAIDGH